MHHVDFYYTDVSICTVNKTQNYINCNNVFKYKEIL